MTETSSRPRALWAGWIAAGVLLLIASVAGVYAANLRNQLQDVELRLVDAVTKLEATQDRLVAAAGESDAIRANLSLLSAPDSTVLTLRGKGTATDATARAFVSPSKGLLFSASKLPPLPDGRTYQLWLVSSGAPINAGIVHTTEQGTVTAAFDPVPNAPSVSGFFVSIEPEGGAGKPSGAVVLSTS